MDIKGPAPLFEKIKGYPEGYKILGLPVGPTKPYAEGRVSLALDLPKDTDPYRLISEFKEKLKKPIKPRKLTS
jgi:hypothetical protein